jgi:hypothetical protein
MADVVELLGLSVIFATLLIPVCLVIYLDYKQKRAMIEKGIVPDDEKSRPESKVGWGIAMLGIGISLIVTMMLNLNSYVSVGLVIASIGISLLASYQISKQQQ